MSNQNVDESTHSEDADSVVTTRRAYLAGAAAGFGLFAGCLTGGDESENDESTEHSGVSTDDIPEFTVDESAQPTPVVLAAAISDGPDIVEFLDTFVVELAVGNTGGSAITSQSIEVGLEYLDGSDNPFVDTVNAPDAVSVELPSIESGEWERVEAELRVNAGGTWSITTDARAHPGFEHQIAVEPKRLRPGDAVATEVGHYEVTALEPAFERTLQYATEEGGVGLSSREATGLLSAAEGHVLVAHRFSVRNTSSERSVGFGQVFADNHFPNAMVLGEPSEPIDGDDMRDSLDTLVLEGEGVPFGNNTIEPDETVELVAIQEVSEEAIAEASVTLSIWGGTEDVLFDSITEAPQLPAFELVDATVSDRDSDTPSLEVTVENVGEGPGTFRGAGQFHNSRPTASDWVYLPDGIELVLEPGEQATGSIPASRGDSLYRILPFEAEIQL